MRFVRVFSMMLLCGASSACATAGRQPIADTSCLAFKAISFAQLPPGEPNDPDNQADSDQTVAEVMGHNAAWRTLCEKKDR
jgi:hypothetical protein